MDISEKMIRAIKNRKEDEFNYGKTYIYEGIDLGKIRSKIGYRGQDLSQNVKKEEFFKLNIRCNRYYLKKETKYVIFNIHGGAFYGGGIEVIENPCKYMAEYGDLHVISIDYTLAPDSKFPNTMYEIYNVIKAIKKEYSDNVKYAIIGDSAGAHLALSVALLDVEDLKMFSFVGLFYPVISLLEIKDFSIEKYNLDEDAINAKATILFLKSIMPLIKKLYLEKEYDENSMYLNLLKIEEKYFKKLPKMFLARAEFDYFNLDIIEFIEKYKVDSICYKGLSHGFVELLGYLEETKDMLEKTVDKFKGKL